ncbi:3-phosphoshikimate 1-carboxyvinyltransferase [Allopseudospirillum japonicum]|uniref:3-phosphoshikimate 1-carboxyvinyltransferase n=1 Tax=Allopseudospirillum japonicum TaxID=64971 RepID=A0A1H6SEB5_9GAMM|nr:bifunctional prephenate dehydrogenase/3-phosphoshikimate 1-carboxyvinyltransferase [Allopseudospirillum japonicum]SEI65166.1 3-phosphoshikimate 1-carboxyvinyltransferase [Allopseudospirillum japonicum]
MNINRLLIIGLGLIGGSVALALKQAGSCQRVLGYDIKPDEVEAGLALGVIDEGSADTSVLPELVRAADIILIAVPVVRIQQVFAQIKPHVSAHTLITDVGSCKSSVYDAACAVWEVYPANLVLGHPIAGSEKSGVRAAKADLFDRHKVILTPVDANPRTAIEQITELWAACGAQVLCMQVKRHDEVLARTSHLPHLLAFSLVDTLARQDTSLDIFRYAAGGFRDFTRIAASDPQMWHDIFLANRDATLEALDEFTQGVAQLRTAVAQADSTALLSVFTRAKSAREHFSKILDHTAYSPMDTQNIRFQVTPGGQVTGNIRVPGDKSISHRSIMLGALAEGCTKISGFLEGEDSLATLQAFRDMGVSIDGPYAGQVTIQGVGLHGLKAPASALYLGNSGTSMRLLAGLLAAQTFDTELTGDTSLSKRPMGRVADPLRLMGAHIDTNEGGRPPLKIRGGQTLTGMDYVLPMASAQVKSCLLLAGLYAQGQTRVTEPAPTRDHTERMLQGFGYQVTREGASAQVEGGGCLSACEIDIPADISSATFFMVAACIAPGSDITLEHVGINPTRIGVINILKLMGADLELLNQKSVGGEPVADIRVRYAPLHGIDIPEDQVPLAIDEFPALFIAAACAQGTTRLRGAEELRVKESDRIQVMADGLTTLGIECQVYADGIDILGGHLQGGEVASHEDHRIAMSFTVAALRAQGQITIHDCANVATSFPGFVELARRAGIQVQAQTQA